MHPSADKPKPAARGPIYMPLAILGVAMLAASAPAAPGVEITEGEYEGRPQFIVRTASATWYYDRAGGGISRLIDPSGRDWVAFSKSPLSEFPQSAAAGFRGLGNLVHGADNPDAGAGHPGFDRCESEIAAPGVLRARSKSGRWAWTWTFYHDRAVFTMEQADDQRAWWFLYEGPVAGSFTPARQFWGTSDGGPYRDVPDIRSQRFGHWQWAYFGDLNVPRVLYVAQHTADDLADTFWYLGGSEGGAASAPDGMVVFGFGRGPGTRPLFRGAGRRFTVGFIETDTPLAAHEQVARAVAAAIECE